MTVTRVHVNRHHIAQNRRDGGQRPIYSVKAGGQTRYAHAVHFLGPAWLIDPRIKNPLACGATVYLETEDEVVLVDPCTFDEARSAA